MSINQTLRQNKRLFLILLSAIMILLIPLIAMQFTAEVNWTIFDFVAAGFLFLVTGLGLELILRKAITTKQKILFGLIIFLFLLLIWAELAVGLIGTPFAGS